MAMRRVSLFDFASGNNICVESLAEIDDRMGKKKKNNKTTLYVNWVLCKPKSSCYWNTGGLEAVNFCFFIKKEVITQQKTTKSQLLYVFCLFVFKSNRTPDSEVKASFWNIQMFFLLVILYIKKRPPCYLIKQFYCTSANLKHLF